MDWETIFAAGWALVTSTGLLVFVKNWMTAKVEKLEAEVKNSKLVKEIEQSNSQGDSVISVGKLLASDLFKSASQIATLKPYTDKLTMLHDEAVKVWNDPLGSDAQMNDVVKAANDVFGVLKNVASQVPA
jgi:hypothetical protein